MKKVIVVPLMFFCTIHAMEEHEPRFLRMLNTPVFYANEKLKNLINQDWKITSTRSFNPNMRVPLAGIFCLCAINVWIITNPRSYCNYTPIIAPGDQLSASDCVSKAFIENLWELVMYYSFEKVCKGNLGYIFITLPLLRRFAK